MKWYKHSTDSHDDPDVSDAIDEFGDAGYSVFFIILEIYGREFNQLSDGWLSISQTFLRRKLRKSWTKAEQILNFYQTRARIFYKINDTMLQIKIPKFIDISSNWSKREQARKEALPTEVPTEAPTAKEVEEEVEKKNKELLTIPDFINPETWKAFKDHRVQIKRRMTPHAEDLIIKRLSGFKEEGHDPNEIINLSIENGWISVFAPKKEELSEADQIRKEHGLL